MLIEILSKTRMLFRMLTLGVFYIVMGSYSAQSAFSQVSSDQEACAKAMSGWSAQEKADLCKNGGTLETAKCAKAMSGRSKQERIDLCSKSQK